MNHKPIQFKDLGLTFTHKICFSAFSGQILYGDKIAIIGRNGSGKSTLLQMLHGKGLRDGCLNLPNDLCTALVPQVINDLSELSGGERINRALSKALALNPNCLLLDEPTNHLDSDNRRTLIRLLQNYQGSLILVSHDIELIDACTDILWHIDSPTINVFSGSYADYQSNLNQKKLSIEKELTQLKRQKKDMHEKLMQEQTRAAKSRINGEKKVKNKKWLKMVGDLKSMNAEKSQGKKLKLMETRKQELAEQLSQIRQPEIIVPKFSVKAAEHSKTIIAVRNATLGYANGENILKNIDFQVHPGERIALCGANGSGKSSFLKALLEEPSITKTGEWIIPKPSEIGYLDQHYANLDPDKTVLELLKEKLSHASHAELRLHLNMFLFRKNEEVDALSCQLSGGEKARLSLALIAAKPPALLILDELCNNLDLETKTHVQQVLLEFQGALIVIAHDETFLKAINIQTRYQINQAQLDVEKR
ncbi:MAG: ATP-binding cassette domain-containing protein [Legionella sp.]|jgi:ATPase subunit of ABC transporter with duplicated ATPase domains